MVRVFLIALLLINLTLQADNISSLQTDSAKLRILVMSSDTCNDLDDTKRLATEALTLSHLLESTYRGEKNILQYQALALNNIGYYYNHTGHNDSALHYYKKSLAIREKIGDKNGIAQSYNEIGYILDNLGDVTSAIDYFQKSLKIREEVNDIEGVANSLNNIGFVYFMQGDTAALSYYTRAMETAKKNNKTKMYQLALNNIADVYKSRKDYKKSLEYFNKALELYKKEQDEPGIALILNNIGGLYMLMGESEKGISYSRESFAIRERLNIKKGMASCLKNLGHMYFELGYIDSSMAAATRSFELSKQLGYPENLVEASQLLYKIHSKKGNYKDALEMYLFHAQMRDSLANEKNRKNIIRKEYEYQYQKDKIRIEKEQEKKEAEMAYERKKNSLVMTTVSSGLAIALLFGAFAYNRFRVTRRQKSIIEAQKALVEEKNKDISDSINYAQRIQHALLPFDERISNVLSDYFILYKPKDIVSGDFYWFHDKPGYFLMAVIDCTGHGVPGAFMSMIANGLLNDIIINRGIVSPEEVLTELDKGVRIALKQEETNSRDGMDISLCMYNKINGEIKVASANNPVWVIDPEGKLKEIKATKQAIGGLKTGLENPFTLTVMNPEKGSTIIMFTDGYADQFGGPSGKKLKYKKLEQTLSSNHTLALRRQKELLSDMFIEWKGDLEQVDDVCVVGFRI